MSVRERPDGKGWWADRRDAYGRRPRFTVATKALAEVIDAKLAEEARRHSAALQMFSMTADIKLGEALSLYHQRSYTLPLALVRSRQ